MPLTFLDLGDEDVFGIFMHLDLSSLGRLARVSKRMNELVSDDYLWKNLFRRDCASDTGVVESDPASWRAHYEQTVRSPSIPRKLGINSVLTDKCAAFRDSVL
jgi:hypothetical protein